MDPFGLLIGFLTPSWPKSLLKPVLSSSIAHRKATGILVAAEAARISASYWPPCARMAAAMRWFPALAGCVAGSCGGGLWATGGGARGAGGRGGEGRGRR